MRVPTDNSTHEIQAAFRDIASEVERLKKRLDTLDTGASREDVAEAQASTLSALRKQRLNVKDVMIGGGPNSQIGYVPDPGYGTPIAADQPVLHADGSWRFIADGLIHAVPEGQCGTSAAQRVLNIQASMAVLGGISADSIDARLVNARNPRCMLVPSADHTAASGGYTTIQNNTIVENIGSMADTANYRMVIRTAGLYLVSFAINSQTAGPGVHIGKVYNNGAALVPDLQLAQEGATILACTGTYIYRLAVGDLLTQTTYQNSGGNATVYATGTGFSAYWLAL